MKPYMQNYFGHYFKKGDVITCIRTEDGRDLNLDDFAGLSIEQSNLMVCLKQPVPESEFPLVKRIISGYTNIADARKAFLSLITAILQDEPFWDVNDFNRQIPYKNKP